MFARLSRRTGEFIKISGHINYFNPDLPEPVFCTQTDHCEGCPYPAHGFICWHSDGSCMRTDEQKGANRRRSFMDEDFKRWQEITRSNEDGWVEDHITSLNGNGALYYKGGVDGQYMRISPDGVLTVGTYDGAIPHIGKAIFSYEFRRDYGSFDAAIKVACQLGNSEFLADMFSSYPMTQQVEDSGLEMKM